MKNINYVKRQSKSKDSQDYFETQDKTIEILWENYFKHNSDFCNSSKKIKVADFSCGDMAILNKLKLLKPTINIFGSDIVKRNKEINLLQNMFFMEEFFEELFFNKENEDVYIVMNPPFNQLSETIEHFLKLKIKYKNIKALVLLFPLARLEGKKKHQIMEEYGFPNLILNISNRQSFNTYFQEEKSVWTPPFSVCWSIWETDFNKKTEIKWVKN